MKTNILLQFLLYFTHFFSEREIFETKVVKKIKTHISGSITSYSEIRAVVI